MLHKKTIFIIAISLLALILLIYILVLIFSSNSNALNYVILPLQSTTSILDLSSLFNNNLRTTITISDKNQEVDLFLLSEDFSFFITQKDIFFNNNDNSKINKYLNNFYNHEISSSLSIISNRTQMVFTKYRFGRKAKENFFLCSKNNCDKNSFNMKNFTFMLVEDPIDKISGGIGLGPNEYTGDGAINLFNELYREKYIDNLIWYIDYENEEKKLIIGKYPYEVNSKYNKDDYEFFELEKKGSLFVLNMVKITIGNNEEYDSDNNDNNIKDRSFIFLQDISLIYGPPEYYQKIKNIFFNKYLSNNQCIENTFNYKLTDYLYISCKEDISLKDFPPLIININKNCQFELTYEDLFMKSNEQILFLFVTNKIEKYFNGKWNIGEPFLKKYVLVYNPKEYKIGFYQINKNERSNYKHLGFLGIIILLIVIGVIIYLCLFIFRKYRNRKIRRAALEMKIEEISNKLILNKSENK